MTQGEEKFHPVYKILMARAAKIAKVPSETLLCTIMSNFAQRESTGTSVVQDAVDAQPPNLKPPFGKIIYYLTSIGGYLFAGNRPTAITPTQKTGG